MIADHPQSRVSRVSAVVRDPRHPSLVAAEIVSAVDKEMFDEDLGDNQDEVGAMPDDAEPPEASAEESPEE